MSSFRHKKKIRRLRNIILMAMLATPFLLYQAALTDRTGAVYLLLGVMGLLMLITMKIG